MYHVITTGRHFLSFWGPISSESRAQKEQRSGGKLDQRPHKDYLVDVYDRATNTKGTIVYNNQDKDFNNVKPQDPKNKSRKEVDFKSEWIQTC